MKVFFGALVLNFMLCFNELEASGLSRIKTRPSRNDPEGVDTHLLAQQASELGAHQSYYPQFFDPQSHGYHPHPQEYLHQESSTAASGLKRVSTMPHQNDLMDIDHIATSRLHSQPFSTYGPNSVAFQALSLDEHHSYSPESFHQQFHGYPSYAQEYFHPLNPAEVSRVVKKYNFKNGRLPVSYQPHLPGESTTNDQMHHPKPEESQEDSEHQNVEWLLGAYHKSPYYIPPGHLKAKKMDKVEHKPSIQAESNLDRATDLLQKKLIQKERQKQLNEQRKQEAIAAINGREGSIMNPHATRQTGRRVKGKAASRKPVSDSRFKAEAAGLQSQSSEHDFKDPYSVLIPGHMSGLNPYVELPGSDHNLLPNHLNQWDYPGGSGSSSYQ